jgi:hypothetical protein
MLPNLAAGDSRRIGLKRKTPTHESLGSQMIHNECIACKAHLPTGAKKCSACHSFQNRFVVSAVSLGLLLNALSIALGIVAYVLVNYNSVRATINWRDKLEILKLDTGESLALRNKGDGQIYVERMQIEYGDYVLEKALDIVVPRGEIVVRHFSARVDAFWLEFSDRDEKIVDANIRKALEGKGCLGYAITRENEPAITVMEAATRDRFVGGKVKITLFARSSKTDAPIVLTSAGTILLYQKTNCQSVM